jgi:hypothetical protein
MWGLEGGFLCINYIAIYRLAPDDHHEPMGLPSLTPAWRKGECLSRNKRKTRHKAKKAT